ncbi:MAG: SoxR reducing system RseC family protein [Cocleimonas sp.]
MQFTEETALVSHVEGNFVFLETQNNGSCGNCSSKTGCGSVSSIFTFKPRNKLKINNTLELEQGDSVIVAMAADKLLMATFLMYLSPLILLFIFSLIAKLLMGETASIVAGLCGLFIGLLLVKQFTQKSAVAEQFQPKLIRKIINIETY